MNTTDIEPGPELEAAIKRLDESLNQLQSTLDHHIHLDEHQASLRHELTKTYEERKRLSAQLDQTEGRMKTMQQINKDVSKRLGAIMETIRSILENHRH